MLILCLLYFIISALYVFSNFQVSKVSLLQKYLKTLVHEKMNASSSLEQLSLKKRRNFENFFVMEQTVLKNLSTTKWGLIFFNLTRYRKVFLIFSSYLQLIVKKKFRLDKCFHCLVQTLKHLFCLNIIFYERNVIGSNYLQFSYKD